MSVEMEYQESLSRACCGDRLHTPPTFPRLPVHERLQFQKSNVCSRAYFMVVMVFFHLYIINIIALLLYVNYTNTGSADIRDGDQVTSVASSASGTRAPPPNSHIPVPEQNPGHPFYLPRLEGIRVGHLQSVSLLPERTHKMRTLSLKPLLFEIPGFLSLEESGVVMQLAQLKGLMQSSPTGPSEGLEDELSQEELFSLLDLNQDGLLQREEILSLSRSNDGSWLSARNLREIHTGLETNPAGVLSLQEFRRVSRSVFQRGGSGRGVERRQKSTHTWLHLGEGTHRLLQSIKTRVTRLTRLPSSLVDLSEPLEVVRYEQGGYSHAYHDSSSAHPDSSCAHTHLVANSSASHEINCRYVTVLLYLSSAEAGGESSFPVADNRTYQEEALGDLTQQYCDKGNLKVTPTAGTALLWYNHLSDGKGWVGELDEFSLHGSCLVSRGSTWVGSVWVNVDPDQQRQARYQRLVSWQPQGEGQRAAHSGLHQDL